MRRPAPTRDDRLTALLAGTDDEDDPSGGEEWLPDVRSVDAAPDGAVRSRRDRPRLLSVPSSLEGAQTRPGRWSVVGVIAALVLVAGTVGAWALWTRSDARPSPVSSPAATSAGLAIPTRTGAPPGFGGAATPATTGTVTAASGGPAAPASTPAAAASSSAWAYVHVVGAVKRPGVAKVRADARVVDAVDRVGGPLPTADLAAVNLARRVVDGEQVVVTVRGQRPPSPAPTPSTAPAVTSSGPAAAGAGAATTGAGGLVDLNHADLAALDTLPGVGPVLAQRILDWRAAHGGFTSVDQLGDVEGVGDKTLAKLTPLVRV